MSDDAAVATEEGAQPKASGPGSKKKRQWQKVDTAEAYQQWLEANPPVSSPSKGSGKKGKAKSGGAFAEGELGEGRRSKGGKGGGLVPADLPQGRSEDDGTKGGIGQPGELPQDADAASQQGKGSLGKGPRRGAKGREGGGKGGGKGLGGFGGSPGGKGPGSISGRGAGAFGKGCGKLNRSPQADAIPSPDGDLSGLGQSREPFGDGVAMAGARCGARPSAAQRPSGPGSPKGGSPGQASPHRFGGMPAGAAFSHFAVGNGGAGGGVQVPFGGMPTMPAMYALPCYVVSPHGGPNAASGVGGLPASAGSGAALAPASPSVVAGAVASTGAPFGVIGGACQLAPAAPLPPATPEARQAVKAQVQQQLEYYFGQDNLIRDVFLRTRMNQDGWVAVALLAGFRRIQYLTSDMSIMLEAITASSKLELDSEGAHVRLRTGWQEWPLSSGNPGGPSPAPAHGVGPQVPGAAGMVLAPVASPVPAGAVPASAMGAPPMREA
mmetsp:Transcript_72548/g.210048  ORF Transcript_72548/g.210048 Transcript_72548/m.210048 type:complete len:495 (+) Transcript_72548:96-1580(+)